MFHVFFLGQPRFSIDATPYPFTARPKVLPLLAYLLLHRNTPLARDALAFALWTDESESNARANLRRHLNYLRQALPPPQNAPWLLQENQSVRWNPNAPTWFDVMEFEAQTADHRTQTTDDAVRRLSSAVALYTGDLLENVYEDWLVPERERLRALYQENLWRLVSLARARRDFSFALQYAQQLAQHDSLREDARRILMTLRYETGDRAGALREFEQFRQHLTNELGVEPMPETLALYENILRNEAVPTDDERRTTKTDSSLVIRPSSAVLPLVGRDAEIQQLRARWNRAAEGAGGMLLIGGEAGIGKTRLAQELAQYAEAQGARVLFGSTSFPEAFSYQPFVQALRGALPLLSSIEGETQTLGVLTRVLPELRARRSDLPMPAALDAERERTRLFHAFVQILISLAQPRPLLVILEDAHWAGADTFALLEWIVRAVPPHRVLLVTTYREEEILRAHPLRELRRRFQPTQEIEHLALGRLDENAVSILARTIQDSAEHAHKLFSASEGNPLFITQLLREWAETENETCEMESLPRAVEETIARRTARLPNTTQLVSQAASVLGDTFSLELVRELIGWSERQTLDALGTLLDHQLVSEAVSSPRGEYTFTHHLVRATLYNQIPEADRKRRHHRAARLMQELYSERLDELAAELARHYERGDDAEPAAQFYARAAHNSAAVFANQDALAHVERGLALTNDARTRFELYALHETLAARRGERETQRADLDAMQNLANELNDDDARNETLERAIRLHRALGERDAERAMITTLEKNARGIWNARVLRQRAAHEILLGQYDAARASAFAAQRAFADAQDAAGQVECFCMLAEISAHQGRLDDLQTFVQEAETLAAQTTNQSLLVETLRTGSVTAFVRGDYKTARGYAEQMLTLTRRIADREGEADAHWRLANAATRLFHIQDAQMHFDAAAALFEQIGKTQGRAAVLLNRGSLLERLGQRDAARENFQNAFTLFEMLNDSRGQGIALINLAYNSFYQNAYGQTLSYGERALDVARTLKHPAMEANALTMQGWAHGGLGNLEESRVLQERGIEIRRALGASDDLLTDFRDLALTCARMGKLERAQEIVNEMLAAFESLQENATDAQTILWAAAVVSRARGDTDRATDFLNRAYALLQNKADSLPEPALRETFLRIPYHRAILRAYNENVW